MLFYTCIIGLITKQFSSIDARNTDFRTFIQIAFCMKYRLFGLAELFIVVWKTVFYENFVFKKIIWHPCSPARIAVQVGLLVITQ